MKTLLITFLLLAVTPLVVHASCYTAWLEAFEDASQEYEHDKVRCESALSQDRCIRDADRTYDNQLWDAGNEYYHCVT